MTNFLIGLGNLIIWPIAFWLGANELYQIPNQGRKLTVSPSLVSLNLTYSYLLIDVIASALTCFSLYFLTYESLAIANSPSAWLVRWGGIFTILVFYTTQFPIKLIVKLLWVPIFARISALPKWIGKLNGVSTSNTLGTIISPWREGFEESASWIGVCIVAGSVVPYLAVIVIALFMQRLIEEFELSPLARTMFGLLQTLSDWSGALVILALTVNLLYFTLVKRP